MMNERPGRVPPIVIQLGETPTPSRKGYFLLIPWMLLGAIWLRINTGLDRDTVEIYTFLLLASVVSLLVVLWFEPKMADEMKHWKFVPFVLMYGVMMAIIITAFAVGTIIQTGTLTVTKENPEIFGNNVMMTVLLVAPIETLAFQWILPKSMYISLKVLRFESVSGILAQIPFALFHWSNPNYNTIYGHNWTGLLAAFFLGVVFYIMVRISRVWGPGCTMGAHAGWNISILFFSVNGSLANVMSNNGSVISPIMQTGLPLLEIIVALIAMIIIVCSIVLLLERKKKKR